MLSRRLFAAGAAGAPAILAGAASAEEQRAESTIDRVKRTKVLRIAALAGEAPYFNKDIASGSWSGMCIDMAKDIAGVFEAQVEYIESTYGNSVLDLQANKIDIAFSLNPTPKRALVIDFTHAFYLHGFGMVGKKGFHATNWSELDNPDGQGGGRYRLGTRDRGAPLCAEGYDHRIESARRLYPRRAIRAGRLRHPRGQSGIDRSQEEPGARRISNAAPAARPIADLHGRQD